MSEADGLFGLKVLIDQRVPNGELWLVPNPIPKPGETQEAFDRRRLKGVVRLVNLRAALGGEG